MYFVNGVEKVNVIDPKINLFSENSLDFKQFNLNCIIFMLELFIFLTSLFKDRFSSQLNILCSSASQVNLFCFKDVLKYFMHLKLCNI